MDGGANPFRSMHRDVLDANPEDEYVHTISMYRNVRFRSSKCSCDTYAVSFLHRAGKENLITEIRDRAKRSIEQKVHGEVLPLNSLVLTRALILGALPRFLCSSFVCRESRSEESAVALIA